MQSQLTVRLSGALDKAITDLSKKLRLKWSCIVRTVLGKYEVWMSMPGIKATRLNTGPNNHG